MKQIRTKENVKPFTSSFLSLPIIKIKTLYSRFNVRLRPKGFLLEKTSSIRFGAGFKYVMRSECRYEANFDQITPQYLLFLHESIPHCMAAVIKSNRRP